MAFSKPNLIIKRILSATNESPIAVFDCNKPGLLDAVFAATAESRAEIRAGCSEDGRELIGVYDKSMDMTELYLELRIKAGEIDL